MVTELTLTNMSTGFIFALIVVTLDELEKVGIMSMEYASSKYQA